MGARVRLLRLLLVFALAVSGVLTISSVATADPTDTPNTGAGRSADTTPDATEPADAPQAAGDVPATMILTEPKNPSLYTHADFTFSAPAPGLRFECKLEGPGHSAGFDSCDSSQTAGSTSTGSMSYPNLDPSANDYVFRVQAFRPDGHVTGPEANFTWHVYSVWQPSKVVWKQGASFNNPLGSRTAGRTNIRRVLEATNSLPGYKEPNGSSGKVGALCPSRGSTMIPARIRITLYSMVDNPLAKALVAAARRCVSVQVLMNNHLSAKTDGAWRLLQKGLGNSRSKTNWARRCTWGCIGKSVLHTKMFLFDSSVPAPYSGMDTIQHFVLVGSSNMTSNASRIQWNDLYGIKDSQALYDQFDTIFKRMTKDKGFSRITKLPRAGKYEATFWPIKTGRQEPYVSLFHSIKCRAGSGAGIGGRTVIYINMHAWFSHRGVKIEHAVKRLYRQGCVIKILESFMTKQVWYALKAHTGSRMSVRRTVFSMDGDKYADVYSHFKAIAVSGNVRGNPRAHVVWTGSNNFTGGGDKNDEVMLRIADASAYRQYRDRFRYIVRRKSSAKYAYFFERAGGGRAPKPHKHLTDEPTILSPAIRRDENGDLHAVD